ncbi:MAG: hypothetical protein AABZ12_11415 [Planctomycetota bacterium]
MNRVSLAVKSSVLLLLTASVGVAGPRAGIATTAWELDFEFYDPQRISLRLPGDTHETTYWYVVYRVTNRSGQDVKFLPTFRMVTDDLQEVVAGDGVDPLAYDAIADRHRVEFPFFAPPAKVTGMLLQGEVNARTSAAAFKTFDTTSAGFKLLIAGLSGEMKRVTNAAFDSDTPESDGKPRVFLFRRTLQVFYDLPGDVQTRTIGTPVRRSREWIMDPMTPAIAASK